MNIYIYIYLYTYVYMNQMCGMRRMCEFGMYVSILIYPEDWNFSQSTKGWMCPFKRSIFEDCLIVSFLPVFGWIKKIKNQSLKTVGNVTGSRSWLKPLPHFAGTGVVPNNFKSSACMLGLEVWIWLVGGVSLLAFAWHFSKCFTSMQVTIAWNTIMQILPQYLNWSPICLFNPIQATKYQC